MKTRGKRGDVAERSTTYYSDTWLIHSCMFELYWSLDGNDEGMGIPSC